MSVKIRKWLDRYRTVYRRSRGRTGTGTGPIPINRKLDGQIRVPVPISPGPTASIIYGNSRPRATTVSSARIVRFSRYLAISRATCETALYDSGKSAAVTGGE